MPDSTTLTVSTLTYLAPDGAVIFSGRSPDGNSVRVVAGKNIMPRPPVVGELWDIAGKFREHSKYGWQLYAQHARYVVPKGRLLVRYLADHPSFSGIGIGKAQTIYDAFGDQLVDLLNAGDAERLSSVLSASMASQLVSVWAENQAEAAVVAFLDEHGFDIRLANKLRRVWGTQAIQMLERNPYYMLAFTSWTRTDAAATKMGLQLDDTRRLVGAVEAVLYSRLHDGHTMTPIQILHERLPALLGRWVTDNDVRTAIALATSENAIVGDDNGFQPVGAASLEQRISERIHSMLNHKRDQRMTQGGLFPTASAHDAFISTAIAENEQHQGFALNAQQRAAVNMVFKAPFSVLTGGAGVGKTTVLRVIHSVASKMRIDVVQMALAGRAAKRMGEASGHDAMTIAKFLHLVRTGQLEVASGSLIVIDEASMLDLTSMFQILRHAPMDVRILLIGDAAQLPPIGFGLVFHQLASSAVVPRVELTEVHRQAAETGIPLIAASIREHIVPDISPYAGTQTGISFIECDNDGVTSVLQRLANDWDGDEWQVLSAIRMGTAGINAVNAFFHESSAKNEPDYPVAIGEPVIHLVNDYERGLMNGTLGRVVDVDEGKIHVDFEGTVHAIPAAEAAERLELAYAISVHKAQGSQFDRVAVVVTQSRILDHALIYTALTRGVEQVVFVGGREAFETAVRAPAFTQQRHVGAVV
ncbi:AAA family ATPase [Halodesulfovibrio sp. MK-HDV]|jgi:exodeoxyribonuclease V alpha subunit|uniref:AAA family ATPase n=1 Tax=Halodesulfovibrio sp. MK-HDV TaxID=2599925 RepID=UPI001370356E|nr:AAA family ATPase [Halodesulfovibrio sp. MK-HDV]KAF1075462.1 ATP-dependent RecD-like DNA helicase [Halodesulfovibrio sp. MK-HDV]